MFPETPPSATNRKPWCYWIYLSFFYRLQTRLTALERDNRELERVTSDLRDARARVTTLEDQNKTMQSQRFVEQKELAIAREVRHTNNLFAS